MIGGFGGGGRRGGSEGFFIDLTNVLFAWCGEDIYAVGVMKRVEEGV